MDPLGRLVRAPARRAGALARRARSCCYLPNFIVRARLGRAVGRSFRSWAAASTRRSELGSYQLVELLGQGGMGEVWRAEHRLLARDAAVKLVRPEVLGVGDDAEARLVMRRFEREARATAALSSPHTIQRLRLRADRRWERSTT